MRFILASSSKNRQALLERMLFKFESIAPDYEEIPEEGEETVPMVERFAIGKAQSVYQALEDQEDVMVLGCDSMIALEGKSIGKAYSEKEAIEQMMFFRGKRQEVITGLALIGKYKGEYFETIASERTPLDFRDDVDEALIKKYLAFGDWEGKCGSYSILGTGIFFLDSIGGDFQNVVGLPILRLGKMIESVTSKHPLELLEPRD